MGPVGRHRDLLFILDLVGNTYVPKLLGKRRHVFANRVSSLNHDQTRRYFRTIYKVSVTVLTEPAAARM